jgi:hypothetical protein
MTITKTWPADPRAPRGLEKLKGVLAHAWGLPDDQLPLGTTDALIVLACQLERIAARRRPAEPWS